MIRNERSGNWAILFMACLIGIAVLPGMAMATSTTGKILVDSSHLGMISTDGFIGDLVSQGWIVDYLTTGPINTDKLNGYDILIMPSESIEPFTASEVSAIKTYVNGGGGIWIFNEYDRITSANAISSEFGVTFNSDTVTDNTNNIGGHNTWPDINTLESHSITNGITSFGYYAGSSLNTNSPAKVIARGDIEAFSNPGLYTSNAPVLAVVEYGLGRGVFIGDQSTLNPFYYPDNLTTEEKLLLSNIVDWLNNASVVTPTPTPTTPTPTPPPTPTSGDVWAWGYNGYGQLGDATLERADKWSPIQMNSLSNVIKIAGGGLQSMALKSDGTVWICGQDNFGYLGDGSTRKSLPPTQVSGLTGITDIAASGSTFLMALASDGTVWTWSLKEGPGLPPYPVWTKPTKVTGLTNVIKIAAGNGHAIVLKSDGTVWTWGENFVGQLGDGTRYDRATPVQVVGLSDVIEVAAGPYRTIALKSDGTVWNWGSNSPVELGYGLTPVQIEKITDIIKIAGGYYHTVVLKSDGTVWSLGGNSLGQLGDGTTQMSLIPVQAIGLSSITDIASGAYYTVVLKSDGTVWTWGYNNVGQLGIGSTETKTKPTLVQGVGGVTAIAAGSYHTLALLSGTTAAALPGEITAISTNPEAPITYGADYKASHGGYGITLSLYNPNDIAQYYKVALKNDEVIKDGVITGYKTLCYNAANSDVPVSITVLAHETRNIDFKCKSNWDWIPPQKEGFVATLTYAAKSPSVQDAVEEAMKKYSTKLGSVLEIVGFVSDIVDTISTWNQINTHYSYHVRLDSASTPGIKIDPNAEIDIDVSLFKQSFLGFSILTGWGSNLEIAMIKKAPALALPLGIGAALAYHNAWYEYQLAYDPDFNYTTVQEPVPLDLPELDAMPDGDAKKFALAYADVASLRRAIFTAYVRADGARIDNQPDYRLMQLEAANNFTLQSMDKMSEAKKYYKLMTASIEPMTDEEIENAKEEIRTNGLPQVEIDMLTRNGMGFIIESKTQAVLNASPELVRNPKNFTKFMDIGLGFLTYENNEYMSQIIATRIIEKGMVNTSASPTDIAELEDLKSQINQSINQGTGTPETKALIDEMIGKSREVLDETNNLAYMSYYEFAVNTLAILPALDNTPPEITITLPANRTSYALNQVIHVNWQAIDPGSGISSATATAPNGSLLDTSSVGLKTFIVNVTDNSGNQASMQVTYYVAYKYIGPLPPFKTDGNITSKIGSTVPVKIRLQDGKGENITNAIVRIYVTDSSRKEINGTSAGNTNKGNLFRYDSTENIYIFNLETKLLTGTVKIRIELDDGTSKFAYIMPK